jgi:hypothetical protein
VQYDAFVSSGSDRTGPPREVAGSPSHATRRVLADRLTLGEYDDVLSQPGRESAALADAVG